MVVCTALRQRINVKRLTETMRTKLREKSKSKWYTLRFLFRQKEKHPGADDVKVEMDEMQNTHSARRHSWSPTHSFHVIMGGFAFDISNAKPNFLPYGRSRLTLYPKAIDYTAEHAPHLTPDLSEEEFRDKSKAGALAKLIVCLQVAWYSMQYIARLTQNQALSFLELHTFCYAMCALFIYA